MAVPVPLVESFGTSGAQLALKSGFASALGRRANLSAVNLATAFEIDLQGFVRPSIAYQTQSIPFVYRDALTPWLGVDAWTQIQLMTQQEASISPTFAPTPDVEALYTATDTQPPWEVQFQPVPEAQIPAPVLDTGAEVVSPAPVTAQPTDGVSIPLVVPAPTTTPLVVSPTISGARGVPLQQGTTQWADWQRTQTAVALHEILDGLKPVLPAIFEEQLSLTGVEQDVLRASAAVLEPTVVALERATDLIRPAQEAIDAGLLTPLETVRTSLAEVGARLRGQVIDTLGAAGEAINSARTAAIAPVTAALDTATEAIANFAAMLEVTTSEKIAQAQEQIAQAMAETVSTDQAIFDWFQSLIPNPQTFVADVVSSIRTCGIQVTPQIEAAVTQGIAAGIQANVGGDHSPNLTNLFNQFLSTCGNLKNFGMGTAALGMLVDILGGVATGGLGLLGGLFNMLQVNGLASAALLAVFAPSLELTTQDAFLNCPIRIPSLGNAKTALRLHLIEPADYEKIALRNGYTKLNECIETANQVALPSVGDVLTDAVRSAGRADAAGSKILRPAVESMQEIRRRMEDARPLLREHGFRDDDINKLLDNAPLIPPVSDLITFVRRDVFDEKVVDEFDLFSEFPKEILPLTRMQGLADEFVKYYHGASWSVPSLTQLYDMYHRIVPEPLFPDAEPVVVDGRQLGYRMITRAQIEAVQRAQDVLKVFREPQLRLSDRPLTRVDTRRAFVMGALDDDAVLRSYITQGYSPENASILLRFNKVEKERSLLSEVGEQRRAVAVAFASAYERGVLDEHSYSFALRDLGYDQETANLAVTRSRLERQLIYLRDVVGAVKTRFIKGKIDQDAARDLLEKVGIGQEEIRRNLQVWCYQIGCNDTETVQEKEKEVSKAEILAFYADGLIGQDAAAQRLVALGYRDDDVSLILANADIKRLRTNQKAAIKRIHDNYLSNTIDYLSAGFQLDGLGIPTETRDLILGTWREELEQSEIKRAREVYLSPGDNRELSLGILNLLGLPPDEVSRLLDFWQAQKEAIERTIAPATSNGTTSQNGAIQSPT